ncbi:hypothetical protein SAMN06298212_10655 [Ruaniaceae bacterium KH17]|nr:hypothetical protein SAMN06298212_10655 [Ruaniaceae bacterium KH17]
MTSQTPPSPAYPVPAAPQPEPPAKNTLGTIALVLAIVGFIFACIPGALIVGWILLPIAFILSIVALVAKNKRRGGALAALIISIVGTIVGVIVFVAVVGNAVDDAFNENVTAQPPAATESAEPDDDAATGEDAAESAGPDGTRANPYPIGTELRTDDWTLVVNGVDLDATDAVMAENEFNDPPEDGNVYILVNLTATYTGSDAAGAMPWALVEYVSAGGNTFDALSFDTFAVAPDAFDSLTTLYEGASTTGNAILQVPAEGVADGTLAITVDMFSDKIFVAVQ